MRIGRLIFGSAVLGTVGTLVYKNASDGNKKKLLNYVKKAVDWLPSRIKGYIPSTILDKLSGNESGGRETGDVSRSAGPRGSQGGSSVEGGNLSQGSR
jgi:hypothetical protein